VRSKESEAEIEQMMTLAKKHGYSLRPDAELNQELGVEIVRRMKPRRGNDVYQMMTFNIPCFPRGLMEKTFLSENLKEETDQSLEWKLTTLVAVGARIAPIISASGSVCSGVTTAFRTKSQPVIRNVAHLVADFEASHVLLPSGLSRAYFNGMYVIISEHGVISWPKDNNRNEIAFPDSEEKEIRQHVLSDMLAIAGNGHPISPGWWRQLGNEAKAREVEAELAKPKGRKRSKPQLRPHRSKQPRQPRLPRTKPQFWDVAEIVAERKVATKAKRVYLVRWAGYDAAWETMRITGQVGDPIWMMNPPRPTPSPLPLPPPLKRRLAIGLDPLATV
jgi:hypothetical protein